MISILLYALVIAAIGTLLWVFGRLMYDTFSLFASRRRERGDSSLPPLWRDARALRIVAQVVFLVVAAAAGTFLWGNFIDRTDAIGLNLSFDFLDQPAGITIADNPLTPNTSVRGALTAGFFNTVRVILIGVPVALTLGTLVGIARLSTNWLVTKLATLYVEFFRNIPVLVVIIFIWQGVFLNGFPRSQESWKPLDGWFIFNNSRFAFPSLKGDGNLGTFQIIMILGLLVAAAIWWWRTRVFDQTGRPHRRVLWSLGTLLAVGAIAYFALGGPFVTSKPMLDDRGRVYTDGIRMQMPYAALTTALIIYTATHISEIVRGSILAVNKGQVEAANALALSSFQRYRFVVLPQAMRIAWPPLINQFLNLSKNSSLAVAIGFAEITSIQNNLQGQSFPSPQLILLMMLLYLALSLVLSAFGNLINRQLQIEGR